MVNAESLPLETIGIIVIFSLVLSILFKRFGQNPVLGFILSGFLLGPFVFGFLSPTDELVKAFAELGLFVLLFYLGLELSFKEFLKAGIPTLSLALADLILLAGVGILIAYLAGFSIFFSAVIGVILISHSSAIVGKFILDKGLIKQKSAQMGLAILIVEDFLGILLLVFLTSFSGSESPLFLALTAGMFAIVSFYTVHRVSGFVEKFFDKHNLSSTELALYGIGIGLIVATVASFLKLSPALGAYFAGFALSEFKAGEKVKDQIGFLRDFFILFFFVSFGTSLFFNPETNLVSIPPLDQLAFIAFLAILFSIAIIVVNAVVFTVLGPVFGLTNRESSEVAVYLTPLGEFVIIIAITVLPLLKGNEAIALSPIAFLMILFTLLFFQPLYNRLGIHDKLTSRIPALAPRPKDNKPIKEYTSESRKHLHDFGINLLVVFCLFWMTILLYEAIPKIGVPIPFGRTIAASLIFAFLAWLPINGVVKNGKKLFKLSLDKISTEKIIFGDGAGKI